MLLGFSSSKSESGYRSSILIETCESVDACWLLKNSTHRVGNGVRGEQEGCLVRLPIFADNGVCEGLYVFVNEKSMYSNQSLFRIWIPRRPYRGYPVFILLKTQFSPSSYPTLAFHEGSDTLTAYIQVINLGTRNENG